MQCTDIYAGSQHAHKTMVSALPNACIVHKLIHHRTPPVHCAGNGLQCNTQDACMDNRTYEFHTANSCVGISKRSVQKPCIEAKALQMPPRWRSLRFSIWPSRCCQDGFQAAHVIVWANGLNESTAVLKTRGHAQPHL